MSSRGIVCEYHPDRKGIATCTLCANSICEEDRRIKVIEGEETLLCPVCFQGAKKPMDRRMLLIATNLLMTIGVTFVIVFLS